MNEMNEIKTPATEAAAENAPQKQHFSPVDAIFALLFFVFGDLTVRWFFFVHDSVGLGTFVLVAVITALTLSYLKLKKIPLTWKSGVPFGVILLFSTVLFLSDNDFIKMIAVSFAVIAFLYAVLAACKNGAEEKMGDLLPFDLLKSTVFMPFSRFGAVCKAPVIAGKNTAFGKKILLVLGGILAALIPTVSVFRLLSDADGAFSNLTDLLFSNFFENLPREIFYFCFGIPVAMFLFGMLYANATHAADNILTRPQCESTRDLLRFVPVLFTAAAITPILIVYVLFFFSQTSYFLSAFSGIRPEEITFAEYARQGFFELCRVSVINLFVILFAEIFTKRQDGKKSPVVKGYIVTLSVFTLGLIAIALSKMILYIDAYGLSLRRLYPTWFMVVLTVLFFLILLKQFREKLPLLRVFAISFTVLLGVLLFADADAMVARYNVNAYKTGKLDTVDVNMMYELSDSAIPYVLELVDDENEAVAAKAREFITFKTGTFSYRDDRFESFNLATHRAKKLLEDT